MSDEFRTFAGVECIVVRDDKSGRIAKIMPKDDNKVAKQSIEFTNALLEFMFKDACERDAKSEEEF